MFCTLPDTFPCYVQFDNSLLQIIVGSIKIIVLTSMSNCLWWHNEVFWLNHFIKCMSNSVKSYFCTQWFDERHHDSTSAVLLQHDNEAEFPWLDTNDIKPIITSYYHHSIIWNYNFYVETKLLYRLLKSSPQHTVCLSLHVVNGACSFLQPCFTKMLATRTIMFSFHMHVLNT